MFGSALVVALLAASGYALSASLQHVAVGQTRGTTLHGHRLLAHLFGRPWWLLGQVVAFAAFGLHALALHLGSLAVVQPVVVSAVVLAVPVRAMFAHRLPSRGELATVTMTAAGVALFLTAARPSLGHVPPSTWPAGALTAFGMLAAMVAILCARQCQVGQRAGFFYGLASGVMFGLVAGLLKLTSSLLSASHSPLTLVSSWSTWAVIAIGLSGVAATQYGYRATGISASLCTLNMTDVVVALAFGDVVFGEVPAHDPLALSLELIAVVLVTFGLRRLSSAVSQKPDSAGAQPSITGPAEPASSAT